MYTIVRMASKVALLSTLGGLALLTAAEARQTPAELTLEDAIQLALRNNPDFRIQRNATSDADWAVREAYGSLMPGAAVSGGMQYIASGTQRVGVLTGGDLGVGETPAFYLSSYSVGATYRLSGPDIYRIGRERANRRAAESRLEAAEFTLTAEVTARYLAALRARDGVDLARNELERADDQLRLARARREVGAATELEVTQAEVERGRAEIALLQAEQAQEAERFLLVQLLGIDLDRRLRLASTFTVFEPEWDREYLLRRARDSHPRLAALHAADDAATAATRAARGAYLPTVELSAGYSGYTRQVRDGSVLIQQARSQASARRQDCETFNLISERLTEPLPGTPVNCGQFLLTPEDESAILSGNRAFPFDFTREPLSAQIRVSVPIFQGFTRRRQLEGARIAEDDARQRLRAEELRLTAEVSNAFLTVQTAHRAVALEERNLALARRQLELASERYRLGSASFLELMDAQTMLARAERSHLAAVYAFHEGVAALEAAVGQPLPR